MKVNQKNLLTLFLECSFSISRPSTLYLVHLCCFTYLKRIPALFEQSNKNSLEIEI